MKQGTSLYLKDNRRSNMMNYPTAYDEIKFQKKWTKYHLRNSHKKNNTLSSAISTHMNM